MAAKKMVETRHAVILETPKGDRVVFTCPVRQSCPEIAAQRAEHIRAKNAAETGYPARVTTFTHVA